MRWFLIFNPFVCLNLVLLVGVLTLGFLLAVNVLRVEIDDVLGSKNKIASDPEHVYTLSANHRSPNQNR